MNTEITAEGHKTESGKWSINTSDILTKLIKIAGNDCERWASDLFISWKYDVDIPLENGTMETGRVIFGFRKDGVDGENYYNIRIREPKMYGVEKDIYREVWFLDTEIKDREITMKLHKKEDD